MISSAKAKWRRYSEYRPSGVEWLGEIPEHWKAIPVKRQFDIQLGKMLQNNPGSAADVSAPYIKALYVLWGKVDTSDLPEMWASPDDIMQFEVKSGDLLVCEGGEAGRAGIVDSAPVPCIIQNALHRVRGKGADVRYLQYVLHAVGSGGWFDVLCNKTTIAHFTREKLAELRMPLPPSLDEQRAIAAFLDQETARIDALIAKKERQIELLQERRTALISHAVTKGLDPDVKTKDSGIEWLGYIPGHWEIHKLKHVASVNFSSVDKHTVEGEQPVRLCNYVDVYYNDFITPDISFMEATASLAETIRFALKEGDVLVTKDSEAWDDIAVPAYVTTELKHVLCGYHLAHIRPNVAIADGKYLFRAFSARGLNYQFRVEATGITRYGLSKYGLDNSCFLVPPIEEQHSIAAFLDQEAARIDVLTDKIRASIENLREYRTALISAAVTGKIDVREEID